MEDKKTQTLASRWKGSKLSDAVVIKLGGNEIDDLDFLEHLAKMIGSFDSPPCIVHGGGKEVTQLQEKFGLESRKIAGLRVTSAESLKLTEMVLSGVVNKRVVRIFQKCGLPAFGMSGVDGALLRAKKLVVPEGDLEYVGTISSVNASLLETLLDGGFLPIISPLSLGEDGECYNVNADQAAQGLAENIKAKSLVFLTNVDGVMVNGEILSAISADEIENLIAEGHIYGGMEPKVRAAVEALTKGTGSVVIASTRSFLANGGTRITS